MGIKGIKILQMIRLRGEQGSMIEGCDTIEQMFTMGIIAEKLLKNNMLMHAACTELIGIGCGICENL